MKKISGMLKRTLASFLAVLTVMTAGNVGFVASVFAHSADYDHAHVSLGELIVDAYDEKLTDAEKAIIKSGQLQADDDYSYVVPSDGDGLIVVDEKNKQITASVYTDDEDNKWYPTRYRLLVGDDVMENEALDAEGKATYTYGGNAFSVEVTYVLEMNVDSAKQQAMLDAGSLLAQDIDKLLLLKANIIPEKPEGWDEMSPEDQKKHKDYKAIVANEKLQKFVNDAMEQVTGKEANVTLTPETVLTFLVMPALDYENEEGQVEKLSAIELIGKLGAGITEEVTIPEELIAAVEGKLNILKPGDGEGVYKVEIGFNLNNKAIIDRLVAQKLSTLTNNNLDLGAFLQKNKENSYLEWLMVSSVYEALVSALTSNYDDLYKLKEEASALPGVLSDLKDLLTDVELIETAAWDLITTTAAEYGQIITNKAELDNVLTPAGFDSVLASQMGELNAKLPELKNALTDNGYTAQAESIPSEITTKAQLEALLGTLDGVKSDAETKLDAALSVLRTDLKNYGYPADLADAIDSSDDLNAVDDWLDGRIGAQETVITNAVADANDLLADTDYTGTVGTADPAADIETAIAWLTNTASPEVKAAQQKVDDMRAAAQSLAKTLGYPNYASIATSDNVDTVGTWLQAQINADKANLKTYVDMANGYIKTANEQLPADQQYTDSITTSADIDKVITWLGGRISAAEADYATALSTLNTQLTNKGYTGDAVTCAADIDNVVVPWISGKLTELKRTHADACATIEGKLVEKGYDNVTVNSSTDLDNLASSIYSTINNNETVKGSYATFELPYPVSTIEHVNAWILKLEDINATGFGNYTSQLTTLTNMKANLEVIESASAGLKEAEGVIATLEGNELTTLLENAEAELAKAEALLKQAKDNSGSLSSAKTAMANLEDAIERAEEALPGQLTQLTDAKDNLKAAEDALLNVNDPYAAKINQLRAEKGKITSAQDQIAADEAEKLEVAKWKTNLGKIEEAFGLLNDAVTKMQDGLAAANGAYDKLEEVAGALDTVAATKTELNSTISMLEILITLLDLFCTTIEPVYDSCVANDWNVRSVLVNFDQDHYDANPTVYDDLTEWATGLTAPEIEIDESLYVTEAPVRFNMSMYDVTVVVKADVIGQDNQPEALADFSAGKVTLLKDATAAEVKDAIEALDAETRAKDFWEDVITDENYEVTYDALPDTLTEDLTYVIKYTPKVLTVTYEDGFAGEHGLPTSVPYGYLLTLPKHGDPLKEWEYIVTGRDGKLREGSEITITAATTIKRVEGDASAEYELVDLIIETTPALTAVEKSILNSNAIKLDDVIYVRMPNGEMITVDRVDGVTTVTAPNYDSNVAGEWTVTAGKVDGALVTFTNGKYTTSDVFDEIIASYQLSMTAAQLGLTAEELEEYLNTPFILASNYKFQKETLDALVAALTLDGPDADNVAAPLEALEMLRRDFMVEKGEIEMPLGNALSNLDTLAPILNLELTEETRAAAAALLAVMPEDGSHVPLYDTLMLYRSAEGGMEHYYKNEQAYIDQINQLSSIMTSLTSDTGLMTLLGSFKDQFDAINNALSAAASLGLPENRIRTDLIDVESPFLSDLLVDLAKYDEVGQYDAPDSLKWVLDFTKAGPDKVSYTVNVKVPNTPVRSATIVKGTDEEFDPIAVHDKILAEYNMIPGGDEAFYTLTGTEVSGGTYTYTYGYTVFESVSVEIGGVDVVVGTKLSMENTTITLPVHDNPNVFRYDYTVNGVAYEEGASITLKIAQFKALINGTLVIDRTEVNKELERLEKEAEEKRKQEQQLIRDLGGLGVMTKVDDGKYALVLNLNIDDPQTGLKDFVIGLLTNPYEGILLGGNEFYGKTVYGEDTAMKQIHLQALIDAILNSGLTDEALLAKIDENGNFRNDFVLPGTCIDEDVYGDLGSQLVKTTMAFQKPGKDDVVLDFYITLSGNGADIQNMLSALPESVGLKLDGSVSLSAGLDGYIYTAYLAALSMVGKADMDDIQSADAKAVIGYMLDLLDPVLTDDAITLTTIENTLAQLGMSEDLSAYEDYFNLIKKVYDPNNVTYTGGGFKLVMNDIDANGIIDSLQTVIDEMEDLPVSVDLATLIYEYDDPAYDNDEYGLDIKFGMELSNITEEYDVIFVDVKADDIANKFGMTTVENLDLGYTSVVILVNDIEDALVIDGTTTFVDLNGFNVTGGISAINGADVIVVDSAHIADGVVDGAVSADANSNISILGGKYTATLTEDLLGEGYVQNDDGTVANRLFTVTETDEEITVTLNATPEDVKTLMSERGVIELAAEVLIDLVVNHYNAAALSMDEHPIYDISINDLLSLVSGDGDDLVNAALNCVSTSELAEVFNIIVDNLTDFEGMATALAENGDGVISEHKFTTAIWALALGHDTENDVLAIKLGSSPESAKTKTVKIKVVGDACDDMATLAGALGETVEVESKLDLDGLVYADGKATLSGTYEGSVIVDFVQNPGYVLTMAVILADGADADLKADLVAGIEAYAKTADLYALTKVFNSLSVKDICDALVNHNKTFTAMLNGLSLSDAAKAAIAGKVTDADNEMGYALLVDVVSYALFLLDSNGTGESITNSGRTLGSFEKSDDKGLYYGFEKTGNSNFSYSVLGVDMEVTNLTVKVYMFTEHVCKLTAHEAKPATCTEAGSKAYWSCPVCGKYFSDAKGKDEITENSWVIPATDHSWGTADYDWSEDGKTCTAKRVCTNNGAHVETDTAVISSAVKTPASCTEKGWTTYTATFTAAWATTQTKDVQDIAILAHTYNKQVATDAYKATGATCTEAATYYYSCACGAKGTETFKHGDALNHADANKDHVCDNGCSVTIGDHTDANKDHACDYGCSVTIGTHADADKDHKCDYGCKDAIGTHADADKDHKCDYGCKDAIGTHADADKDHKCDYGCKDAIGTHADADKDHKCDYGCKDAIGTHADADKDHKCDYGCKDAIGTHADADKDHKCDYGCKDTIGKCEDTDGDGKCDYGCGKVFAADPVVHVPTISVGNDVLAYKVDTTTGHLFTDALSGGLSVEQFLALLHAKVENDADNQCEVIVTRVVNGQTIVKGADDLLATGDKVTVIARNSLGVTDSDSYDVVVMGDTNGDGRVSSGDATLVFRYFCNLTELDHLPMLAADGNGNGRIESGDANKIFAKFVGQGYSTGLKDKQ